MWESESFAKLNPMDARCGTSPVWPWCRRRASRLMPSWREIVAHSSSMLRVPQQRPQRDADLAEQAQAQVALAVTRERCSWPQKSRVRRRSMPMRRRSSGCGVLIAGPASAARGSALATGVERACKGLGAHVVAFEMTRFVAGLHQFDENARRGRVPAQAIPARPGRSSSLSRAAAPALSLTESKPSASGLLDAGVSSGGRGR